MKLLREGERALQAFILLRAEGLAQKSTGHCVSYTECSDSHCQLCMHPDIFVAAGSCFYVEGTGVEGEPSVSPFRDAYLIVANHV